MTPIVKDSYRQNPPMHLYRADRHQSGLRSVKDHKNFKDGDMTGFSPTYICFTVCDRDSNHGSVFTFCVPLVRDRDGDKAFWATIIRDVTDPL